jgi:hypothetical protein
VANSVSTSATGDSAAESIIPEAVSFGRRFKVNSPRPTFLNRGFVRKAWFTALRRKLVLVL